MLKFRIERVEQAFRPAVKLIERPALAAEVKSLEKFYKMAGHIV